MATKTLAHTGAHDVYAHNHAEQTAMNPAPHNAPCTPTHTTSTGFMVVALTASHNSSASCSARARRGPTHPSSCNVRPIITVQRQHRLNNPNAAVQFSMGMTMQGTHIVSPERCPDRGAVRRRIHAAPALPREHRPHTAPPPPPHCWIPGNEIKKMTDQDFVVMSTSPAGKLMFDAEFTTYTPEHKLEQQWNQGHRQCCDSSCWHF